MLTKRPDWPAGVECSVLPSVDSTMAEAARRAADLRKPTWIMAHHQTNARGRQGKPWVVPPGNLSATLIFKPACSAPEAAQRSFLAANALYDALADYVDPGKLALKWPNDVLLGGGKVAGILLESSGDAGGVHWLAIGFGVNLSHVPQDVAGALFAPTSVVASGGQAVTPEDFLTRLAVAYAAQEDMLATIGFARVREVWLGRAARLGEVVTARAPRDEITGTFDTIDADGNLVLTTPTGLRTISAADVYF